ncbi:MAG: efflux RND transporter periplasmic adaptor subunit [Terracidiphilus sp.]|jgi:multidrug efflux pump subunit AcrA (membrane-fusion protein)
MHARTIHSHSQAAHERLAFHPSDKNRPMNTPAFAGRGFRRAAARLRPRAFTARELFTLGCIAALCLFALLPLAGCGPKTPLAADQPVPIQLRAPIRVQQPVSVAVSGSVEANVTAQSAFQIAGRVAKVFVEEGQAVRKGQVLAELDATDYRNAFDGAQGQADAARAVDSKAQEGLRSQELEQARIDYEQWRDQYTRMKYLYDHKSLPANDFEKIEAAYKAAQQRYEMAKQGTRVQDKEAATGQYHAAAAQMHEAGKRLADTRLVAPISGFVGFRRIDVGDTVGAGAPVISVLDLNPVKVRVAIPEAEIGKVREGAPATVTIPSLDGRQFEGKVETVGVAADPASRTYAVKIAVQNPERLLRAGMVSEARVFGSAVVNAITVPGAAIVRDPQGATQVYVYSPERKRVYARRVEVGAPLGSEVEILSGLNADEQVVVAGQQNVREGSPVRVMGGGQ